MDEKFKIARNFLMKKQIENHKDASLIKKRSMVVVDAFAIYIASLIDPYKLRDGTIISHSLINSYQSHDLINQFRDLEVVQKCQEHRNNRLGHQSQEYGHFIPLDFILSSDIYTRLSTLHEAVATDEFSLK